MGKTLVQKSSLIGVFPGAKHQTCLLWYFFDFVEKIPQQRGFLEDFVPQAPILYATFAHTEKNKTKAFFGGLQPPIPRFAKRKTAWLQAHGGGGKRGSLLRLRRTTAHFANMKEMN
jgi:hypothetical protein